SVPSIESTAMLLTVASLSVPRVCGIVIVLFAGAAEEQRARFARGRRMLARIARGTGVSGCCKHLRLRKAGELVLTARGWLNLRLAATILREFPPSLPPCVPLRKAF